MQDKITIADAPECLNTNDKAMWVLGYEAAIDARGQCLHQIQEPAAAEQAAWHAGQDEGRAQAARPVVVPDDMPSTEANTKYGESYGVDWVYEGKTAAPAAVAVPAMPWREIGDGMPGWTDDSSIRVIAVTANDDFGGVQFHDVPASDFHSCDPDDPADPAGFGTEVTRACTHWAYRDEIWPRAALAATPAADAPLDFLPFSARAAIASRHGMKVTAEFNALVREVIAEYRARAVPSDIAAAAPAGWKLVPIEPTAEMLESAGATDRDGTPATYKTLYMAMVGASPAAAPVVLPEPDAWLAVYEDRDGNSKFYTSTHKDLAVENDTNGKPKPLYTEQKVRALLATATGLPAQAVDGPPIAYAMRWPDQRPDEKPTILWPDQVAAHGADMRAKGQMLTPIYEHPQAQADARDALTPAKPVHPKGMTSINARLSFNMGWMACERHHGIRAEDVEQAVATDAAIAAAKGE